MRRPRRRLEVSTFPFLAVLLCAMGSLILLLLVLDRRAKAVARARAEETVQVALAERDAAARAVAEAAAQRAADRAAERARRWEALQEQLNREKANLATQLQSVEAHRSETARNASAQRQRWRELLEVLGSQREELAKAEREMAAGRGATAEAQQMSEAARKNAAKLSVQLRGLEVVLGELKAARQRESQSYSFLPYHGKRGDGRRPLYVECTADGIVFHPDRKTLTRIATAQEIRSEVQTRVERQRQSVQAKGEPPQKRAYLLMLVRPDGIPAYYGTLAALQGKEVDFGYEFIDADWVLDFPEGDGAPATQAWMTAQRTPVAPADPSAPRRQVAGLRAGKAIEPGGDEGAEGDGGVAGMGRGAAPARGGSSDLPPLPGASGGRGSVSGGTPGLAWGPAGSGAGGGPGGSSLPPLPGTGGDDPWHRSGQGAGSMAPTGNGSGSAGAPGIAMIPGGSAAGGMGAGGSAAGSDLPPLASGSGPPGTASGGAAPRGQGMPNPDGTLPGHPPPAPGGGSGPGPGGVAPGAPVVTNGSSSGSPKLFPFDRTAQAGSAAGGPSGSAGGGQPSGSVANGQTGGTPGQSRSADGGGQPSGMVPNGQTGGTPGGGQPADAANDGQPPVAGSATAAVPGAPVNPGRGGQAHGPDEPQGPNLAVGALSGGERPEPARPPRTVRLIGNRDWVIPVECRPDGVVLRSTGQKFPPTALAGNAAADNPLRQTLKQMIARRQATVRPGEPPYRPQARLLVYPDGLRTYYLACAALEPLGVTLTRQNVDADAPAPSLP